MANAKRCALSVGMWFLVSGPLWGCNTPVYLNALENSDALPFLLFEFREGPHIGQGKEGAGKEARANSKTGFIAKEGPGPAPNLERFLLDLSSADDPLRKQLEEVLGQKVEKLLPAGSGPRVLVLWPLKYGPRVFWSGPLKDLDFNRLTDSPARRALARQLLQRRVVVWLFVPSGDKAQDAKAEEVLRERLKRMEQEIRLPAAKDESSPSQAAGGAETQLVAVKAKFGLLQFEPGKPEERDFERMLHLEALWKEKKVPLAFAVCGRGRVLTVLAGEEIAPASIDGVCAFAVGPCSCSADPGYDLLMTVDWAAGLKRGSDIEKALPPLLAPEASRPTSIAPRTVPAALMDGM